MKKFLIGLVMFIVSLMFVIGCAPKPIKVVMYDCSHVDNIALAIEKAACLHTNTEDQCNQKLKQKFCIEIEGEG